jgi:hypothetical protein
MESKNGRQRRMPATVRAVIQTLFLVANFLRSPLLPTKTRQTCQIARNPLIPLGKSLSGHAKKPAKDLPNTCQKPDKWSRSGFR